MCCFLSLVNRGASTSFGPALVSDVLWKAGSFSSSLTCSNGTHFVSQASAVSFLLSLLICPCSIQPVIAFCISDLKNSPVLYRRPSTVLSFFSSAWVSLCFAFNTVTCFVLFLTFKEIPRTSFHYFPSECQCPAERPLKHTNLSHDSEPWSLVSPLP